jgi:hypothetical protein
MNILGLMLKAVRGTVAEGVDHVLEGMGLSEPSGPEASAPTTEQAARSTPAEGDAVAPARSGTEVVDAVFTGEDAAGPATEPSSTEPPPTSAEPGSVPEPGSEAAGPADLEAAAGEPAQDAEANAVLELLRSRSGALRGFEIAEATGIAPWWRLKDVLQRLIRDGQVHQTEDGLFSVRQGPDA